MFTEENVETAVEQNLGETTLTQYFELNNGSNGYTAEDTEKAKDTLYHDIPKLFKWDAKAKRLIARSKPRPTKPGMKWN